MSSDPSIHRTTAVVSANGTLQLGVLPFAPGQAVEVTVAPTVVIEKGPLRPLHGLPLSYVEPFAPVASDEWDTSR